MRASPVRPTVSPTRIQGLTQGRRALRRLLAISVFVIAMLPIPASASRFDGPPATVVLAQERAALQLAGFYAWINATEAQWSKVAVCEEGGWIGYAGPAFPDSLGITAANWYGNGGGTDLSEWAQITVARRIMDPPPDQNGCWPGGW